jgi:hypothetical protein
MMQQLTQRKESSRDTQAAPRHISTTISLESVSSPRSGVKYRLARESKGRKKAEEKIQGRSSQRVKRDK